MPEVKLISYTGQGHPDPLYAARLLVFTKSTRLEMTPNGFDDMFDWSEARLLTELDYMSKTIPSSWEFIDCVFSMTKVARSTAQQVTRTRTASFAMQSQRVTDMSDVSWDKYGESIDERSAYDSIMHSHIEDYSAAVRDGMALEDAREMLPIGVHCNMVSKYNLRSLVELVRKRKSIRVQGPYRSIVEQMEKEVLKVWPWAQTFFEPPNTKAIAILESVARELMEKGAVYKGPAGMIAKAIDLIKEG